MGIFILKAIIQIVFIAWLLYHLFISVSGTQAIHIVKILAASIACYAIAYFFDLEILLKLFNMLVIPACVFVCVLYQQELRRAFAPGIKRPRFRLGSSQTSAEQIDSILNACNRLVDMKRGALIVFPRRLGIKNVIDTGTRLNADISSSLIITIFEHDTPLHDGAMIIQGSRVISAGCYLPLSEQPDIKKSFGTRHRAALGIAEESDAVVIIVSEETGAISLAYNANLYYQLDNNIIKKVLLALFNNQDVRPADLEDKYEAE